MKRKLNTLELRRLRESDQEQQQHQESLSKKQSHATGDGVSPKRARIARNHGSAARKEDPREHQNLTREKITLMFMEVSEKIDRCFDFDLQKWLGRYEMLRAEEETNFPEVAMLVMSAAQIYGRKVDYLEEIILHMDQDQKGRDESKEKGQMNKDKPTGRQRAARFQPQSLSDCFSDLDFTFVVKKRPPVGSLMTKLECVTVDRRNKFQRMQELCNELRNTLSKQRRQEILTRLREEANIPSIMSSHTVARKNQILDLESGDTIGTRYDYQTFLNFIDVKTGSLMPEHDLKKFFLRCDVIDYLLEQREYKREHCERDGKEASADEPSFSNALSSTAIKVGLDESDSAPFENSRNIDDNQITELDNSASNAEESSPNVTQESTQPTHDPSPNVTHESTQPPHDPSPNVTHESTQPPHDPSRSIIISIISEHDQEEFWKSKESSLEPELVALENQPVDGTATNPEKDPSGQRCPSRLSMEDEGIGADRESFGKQTPSDLERTPSLSKLSDVGMPPTPTAAPFFCSGMVVMGEGALAKRTISLKAALLERNLFKIPECHIRKHLLFSLPPEYKKMKMDLVRKSSDRTKDRFTLAVYSLMPCAQMKPAPLRRALTPELEDFNGFDENANWSRASSPESDFLGFENDGPSADSDIANCTDFDNDNREEPIPENASVSETATEKEPAVCDNAVSRAEPEKPKAATQQSTPTRTMSRDSGIFDQTLRESRSKEGTPEPSSSCSVPVPEEPTATAAEEPAGSDEDSALTRHSDSLIEKVNNWHRNLRPILIESEKRNHFDIHAYGTDIIDLFGPEESTAEVPVISFAQVMEHKQEDFVARYFLSMLMLTNTSNVQLMTKKNQDPPLLTAKEDIKLQLLSRKRQQYGTENTDERISCDNTPSEKAAGGSKSKPPRGKKRKRLVDEDEGLDKEEEEGELGGIQRLRDDDDDGPDDFFERIRRIYPDINSEENKRKHIAFYRGMRRCAYGLPLDDGEEPHEEECAEEPSVPPPPNVPEKEAPPVEDVPDDILSVDLQTDEAIMAPMVVDQDPCCSKSLISATESGYGSIIGAGDC